MASEAIIVNGVTKKFGSITAVSDLSFSVKRNTIYGLLGSNGAGKSTTLHMLVGLLNPTYGEIFILGEQLKEYTNNLKRRVAIVPQKISLYQNLSMYDNLEFFAKAYGLSDIIVRKKISELSDTLKLGELNRKVKTLSGGFKKRLSLAIALIFDPELIILDEALVGIDLETRKIVIDLLIELKKTATIIITTHSLREAETLCDHICFLHKGKKVLEGETRKITREYSKKHGKKVVLTMNSPELVLSYSNFFIQTKFKVSSNGNMLSIEPLTKDSRSLMELMAFVNTNIPAQHINDIEISRSNLEDVMLDIIKADE